MEPIEPEERSEPAPAPTWRSRVRGGLRPAYVLATLMVLVAVAMLITAQPPGFTLRADQRPLSPIEISPANRCSPLRVLPADTTTVRLVRAPGGSAPSRIRLEAPGGYSVTTGAPRPHGRDLDYPLPQATTEDRLGASACLLRERGAPRPTVLGEGGPSVALVGERPGSWLSALPRLSERAAFGRGTFLGTAALPLGLLMVAGACGLLVFLGARHLGSAALIDRRTVVLLGVAGALWGGAYAVTTPPFEAPDEMSHMRYAELIVDRQMVPQTSEIVDGNSPQLNVALGRSLVGSVAFAPTRRPPWSALEDRALDAELKALPAGGSRDTHDNASSQPPTYYGLVAAAQAVAGGSVLDRLLVGRLVSALLFGLGIMGLAVFAREAVPRAGGLVVAGAAVFAALPLTGFVAGSINPDALMVVASAWAFAVTAMIVRRGLTWRRALALGGLIGLGVVSKLTFAGLLPMFLVLALVVLVRAVRARRFRREAPMLLGAAVAAAAVGGPYVLWAILSGRGLVFGPPDPNAAVVPVAFSPRETLTYWFGLFFGEVGPIQRRLVVSGPIDLWGDGLVGRLGWLDYGFPRTAMLRILNVWELLAAGALFGILRSIRARRTVPIDVVVYAVGVFGISVLVARAGLTSRQMGNTGFEQARYLFPFAAVGVAGVALALRQLPRRRWAEWVAAAVLVGALTHGVAGYLITIGRYFA